MRLSVKASDGRVEMFDNVAMMSFQDLRVVVIDRFSLENDFSLMCGSQELPRDKNTKVVALEFGLVSGDRLRLVVTDKPLQESDRCALKENTRQISEGATSEPSTFSEVASNSLHTANSQSEENAIVSLIINEMSKCGFHCKKLAEDGTRLLFRHAESVLSAEVDFHHYEDVRSKCSHVTASIVHPAKRQFLTPVILDEGAHDLRHVVVEHIVSPIRIALLGHENAFLRLLGNAAIVERILKELPVRSILCLERTCVHAYKACNGDYGERVWRVLLERDFGTDAAPIDNETSRNAYRRMFIERKRERQRRIAHDLEFERRHPLWVDPPGHPMPNHPHIPFQPDPDLPEGPMYPQPGYPFIPPENPFPAVPRFQPPRRPRNPLDPFSGSELLPSRPRRPGGLPRQLPDGHSSFADGGFGGSGFI